MRPTTECRRRVPRHAIPPGVDAQVQFGWPNPASHRCAMAVRDISASGLSFVLAHDLPGLELGRSINKTAIRIAGRRVFGDLLVMHITPGPFAGAVCGCLIYPLDDSDVVGWQALVRSYDVQT